MPKSDDNWEKFLQRKVIETNKLEMEIRRLEIEQAESPWKAEQLEMEIESLKIQIAES